MAMGSTDPPVIKHFTGMFPKNWHLKWNNHRTKWGNSPANHGTDAQWVHPIIHPHHSPKNVFFAKQMWFFINQNSGQIGVLHRDHRWSTMEGGPDMLQSAGLQIRPRERCFAARGCNGFWQC